MLFWRHLLLVSLLFEALVSNTSAFYAGNTGRSALNRYSLYQGRKRKLSLFLGSSFQNNGLPTQRSSIGINSFKCQLSKIGNHEFDFNVDDELETIIHRYKFDWNLVKIRLQKIKDNFVYVVDSNSPAFSNQEGYQSMQTIIAEVYAGKEMKLGVITGFKMPLKDKSILISETTPPLVKISLLNNFSCNEVRENIVIDIGQITTIWVPTNSKETKDESAFIESISKQYEKAKKSLTRDLAVNQCERAMQSLWKSHVGRGRASSVNVLTKKQIKQFENEHVQNVLRKANKAGGGMSRLVTSLEAVDHVYNWDQADSINTNHDNLANIFRRIVGSECLSLDAKLGGRFRRLSCTFVSARYQEAGEENVPIMESITLLNGGWITTDASVRAGEEARKFAARAIDSEKNVKKDDPKTTNSLITDFQLKTAADERITKRLECLAMGESLFQSGGANNDSQLELDVRQALSSMNLPTNPRGARDALLKIGRWSVQDENHEKGSMIEPWSEHTIQAAKQLAQHEGKRRLTLFSRSVSNGVGKSSKIPQKKLEYRTDLTALPAVCVDAKSAAFRDDAIGVRPRSITGRKVVKEASKWEILVHIVDVSDIYSPQVESWANYLDTKSALELKSVAENRGLSRYDLPLGPLHLLPPVALEALSFSAHKFSLRHSSNSIKVPPEQTANPCVTLWAYIDERNGQLLDCGLERCIISNPIAFTFSDASDLLQGEKDQSHVNKYAEISKSKAVLAVAERNLSLWSENQVQNNKAAREREKRMAAKELVSREIIDPEQTNSIRRRGHNNGERGFQRTRGHRIVDSALDLYAFGLDTLMRKKKANIPRASGSGADRGGRLGTAPLRRYIDGVAQRQALSVLCNGYGGSPMTRAECTKANQIAGKASNVLNNYKALKVVSNSGRSTMVGGGAMRNQHRQRDALRSLARHLATIQNQAISEERNLVQAISTGRENEVAIIGTGAIAKCKGVKGSLKIGEQVLVKVLKLDPDKGIISIKLHK